MNTDFWNCRADELLELGRLGKKRAMSVPPCRDGGLRLLATFSKASDSCAFLFLAGAMILIAAHPSCAQAQQMAGTPPEDVRDIQGIISLAGLEWWIYAGGLLALIGLPVIIYLLKRKKPAPVEAESAEARALRELQDARYYLQEGMAREFSLVISEILRRYIEQRFKIPVVQRTTEEFLLEMRKSALVGVVSHLDELDLFLKLCDQAKFGREPLTLSEMEIMWTSARTFVEQTGLSVAMGQGIADRKEDAAQPQTV